MAASAATLIGKVPVASALIDDEAALRLDGGTLPGGVVSLGAGAALSGTGEVDDLIVGGGSVILGRPSDVLRVNGDAAFGLGSRLVVAVDPSSGEASSIIVDGRVSLDGSALFVDADDAVFDRADTDIIDAAGGIVGTFAGVETNLAFLDVGVAYTDDVVTLRLARNDVAFAEVARTENQRAVAAALDAQGSGTALYDALRFSSETAALEGFDRLSGDAYAGVETGLIEENHQVLAALPRRSARPGLHAWSSAITGEVDQDGGGEAADVDASFGRVVIGATYAVENGVVATVAGGIGGSDHDGLGATDSNVTLALGSVGFARSGFEVEAGTLFEWHELDTVRTIDLGSISTVRSVNDAATRNLFARVHHAVPVGSIELTPLVALSNIALSVDGFEEAGGDAALSAEDVDRDVTIASLCAALTPTRPVQLRVTELRPYASAAYRRTSGDKRGTREFEFLSGGDPFRITGAGLASHAAELAAGVSATHARWSGALFPGLTTGDGASHLTGGVRVSFGF